MEKRSLAEYYTLKNILNIAKTGWFFNLLANKTYTIQRESYITEEINLKSGCNTDGSKKLSPYVIDYSKKSCCFKNIKAFPTSYKANRKSCITEVIFQDYLRQLDKKNAIGKWLNNLVCRSIYSLQEYNTEKCMPKIF